MADMDLALQISEKVKDKRFHYSWVLDERKSLTIAKMKDYQAVLATDHEGLKDDPRKGVDGQIRVGDLVLMRCPRASYEARQKEQVARTRRAFSSIKEGFHAQAAALQIPSFEDDTK